ncbi:MAG: aldehyde dehydrogenase family protein [Chloroflexota bacterium]|nr:aldehyde dehydrogenase family protein [Chloroflexota bacterium]
MAQTYHNFIGGEWAPPAGETFEVRNPADTGEVVGLFPLAPDDEVRAAIAAAEQAQRAWGETPGPERGEVLYRAAQIVRHRAEELATDLTREEGKTLAESKAEVLRAADILNYFAGEGRRMGGETLPAETRDTLLYTSRMPLGVVAIITPWNFPIAIPTWKIAPALISGNAVVFKPASQAPLTALHLVEVLDEAGVPKGVLNFITGSGSRVGDILVTDERMDGVSFTGSYDVGQSIYQKTARRMLRTQLELGGKNPLIVAADADLDKAVTLAVRGGFGLTGQACTATSRVIVERPVVRDFTERLAAHARALKVGPGLAPGTQMGPAVSAHQRDSDLEYIEIGQQEGAQLVAGGRDGQGDAPGRGNFVAPTVFTGVRPDMRIAQEEIFGPVIGIIEAGDFEEAMQIADGVGYGLTASIVTTDLRKALRFAERVEAGLVKVNQPTTGVPLHAPFGGFKQSSSGTFKEQGKTAVDFYTRIKTVSIEVS